MIQTPLAFAQSDCWGFMIGNTGLDKTDAMTVDADGNVWIAGGFVGTVDFDPDTGSSPLSSINYQDAFLASYTRDGHFRFAIPLSVSGINDMASDSSGNIYMTGFHTGSVDADPGPGVDLLPAFGGTDICVLSFANDGTYRWGKGYGSAGTDEGRSLSVDLSGHVLVCGSYFFSTDFMTVDSSRTLSSAGGSDVFVGKFAGHGDLLWVNGYGGSGFEENSLVLAGTEPFEAWLAMAYEGTINLPAQGGDIVLSSQGEADIAIARIDSSTEIQAAWSIGGSGRDIPSSLIKEKNWLIAAGTFRASIDVDPGPGTRILQSKGESDAFVSSYLSDGSLNWGVRIGGLNFDDAPALAVPRFGGTGEDKYLAGFGHFTDSSIVETGNSSPPTQLISNGFIDSYLASFELATGNLLDVKQLGGSEANVSAAISSYTDSSTSRVILSGRSSGSIHLPLFSAAGLCGNAIPYVSKGIFDFYVSSLPSLQDSSTSILSRPQQLPLHLFPNPATEVLMLEFPTGSAIGSNISVYDIQGNLVQEAVVQRARRQAVSVSSLPKGLFVLQVLGKDGRLYMGRFVKD